MLAGVASCVGAPVAEEIFFRGFLYRSLRNRFTVGGSGFERSLAGNASIVAWAYLLLAVILLARPPLTGLARLLTGKPPFRNYAPAADDTDDAHEQSPSSSRSLPSATGDRAT